MELKLPGGGKVKGKVLMLFTRQLATLIDAGLPLLRGLSNGRRAEKNPHAQAGHHRARRGGRERRHLSEALAQHPKVFNKLYVNMVRGRVRSAV